MGYFLEKLAEKVGDAASNAADVAGYTAGSAAVGAGLKQISGRLGAMNEERRARKAEGKIKGFGLKNEPGAYAGKDVYVPGGAKVDPKTNTVDMAKANLSDLSEKAKKHLANAKNIRKGLAKATGRAAAAGGVGGLMFALGSKALKGRSAKESA